MIRMNIALDIVKQHLTFYGLLINICGALLLIFYPNTVMVFSENCSPVLSWTASATADDIKKHLRYKILNKLGWALLLFGFLLQLFDSYR